ncbi:MULTISPECIES: hypothetical protein [unclassified Microcoleus]|uniref:hypothetical protein n=1 Tax=unclassified Microcoleus TaxID=2642155 RepID=UPI0025F96A64|nr:MULTISPECIES: hypothetical protein [unclassified Microcoleus]
MTGKLLLPHQSYVKKNLSQGAKSRIAHLMGYPSKAFANAKVRSSQKSLSIASPRHKFLPLTFGRNRASMRFYLQPTAVCQPERFYPWAIGCKSSRELKMEV